MTVQSLDAIILCPLSYLTEGGEQQQIPAGSCRVEVRSAQIVALIWGQRRSEMVLLLANDLNDALERGHLRMLPVVDATTGMRDIADA